MKIRHLEIRNFRGIQSLSWEITGDFNCIIGPGDTCKTTILHALDYALTPRHTLAFDDSDFYNQDVDNDIVIQVTLNDWDETDEAVREFFKENKYGQFKCGISSTGALAEPDAKGPAVSISLRVDKSLEPKWHAVKGRDEGEEVERKPIYGSDRALLGISRIDASPDINFSWSRNTVLTRLSKGTQNQLNDVLSELGRATRKSDISGHPSVVACQIVATSIKTDAGTIGVKLTGLSPQIDVQKQAMSGGALSLHEDNIPLRNKGSGSKKLISCAMQMKLHNGHNIALIDEIETGLEPHRIRGLIYRLRNSEQQIFTTTHSPVVLRELKVADKELYVCKRDTNGNVSLKSLELVPEIQGAVRINAEAFLGSRIIVCEGATEVGCLRAYDLFQFAENNIAIWSLSTVYYDCKGMGNIKAACPRLVEIGYRAAAFCDHDEPQHLNAADVQTLATLGVYLCQWEHPNSTENQLIYDLPWEHVASLLTKIASAHDTLEHATLVDLIIKHPSIAELNLSHDPVTWTDNLVIRKAIGDLANKHKWIKRIDYAEEVFGFALPLLPDNSVTKTKLKALWDWVQND